MNPPPKLFENGPEWFDISDFYRTSKEYACLLGVLRVTWEEFPDGSHRIYCGADERNGKRAASSLTWLRARIIAHRDELVRVTG